MSDHKAQILPIIENATRLLSDAKLLYEAKSYRSATALAVLSIEETGKACLAYWKLNGAETLTIDKIVRANHIQKQKVLAAYRFYKEAKPIMDASGSELSGKSLVDQMISTPGAKWFSAHIAAKTGSFDTVKQMGVDLR